MPNYNLKEILGKQMLNRLRSRCKSSIASFANIGEYSITPNGPLTYINQGANVLGVAHLDTVLEAPPEIHNTHVGPVIRCPQLDDRLGVWVLLDVLPMLGVSIDILLTDGEESGFSTAEYFTPQKEYNWMFQFDRCGKGVVQYEYECKEYTDLLESYGLKTLPGLFSDICKLEHLGVTGWNVGTGYYQEHTYGCHAKLLETVQQAMLFREVWKDCHEIKLTKTTEPTSGLLGSRLWRGYELVDDTKARHYSDCDDLEYRNDLFIN